MKNSPASESGILWKPEDRGEGECFMVSGCWCWKVEMEEFWYEKSRY